MRLGEERAHSVRRGASNCVMLCFCNCHCHLWGCQGKLLVPWLALMPHIWRADKNQGSDQAPSFPWGDASPNPSNLQVGRLQEFPEKMVVWVVKLFSKEQPQFLGWFHQWSELIRVLSMRHYVHEDLGVPGELCPGLAALGTHLGSLPYSLPIPLARHWETGLST